MGHKKAVFSVVAGAVALATSSAFGGIFFSLTGPASPVANGGTFTVTLSAYTDNPQGIHDITAKLDQQIAGANVTSALNYLAFLNPAVAIPASTATLIATQIAFGAATTADPNYTDIGIKGRYTQATGLPINADVGKLSSPGPAFSSFSVSQAGAAGAFFSASSTPITLATYTFKAVTTGTGTVSFKVGALTDGATYNEWTDYDNGVSGQPATVNLGNTLTVQIGAAVSASYKYALATSGANANAGGGADSHHVIGAAGHFVDTTGLAGTANTNTVKDVITSDNPTLGITEGTVWVLEQFDTTGSTDAGVTNLGQLLTALSNNGLATSSILTSGADYSAMLAQYGAGGFTSFVSGNKVGAVLFEYTGATGAGPLTFGVDLTGSGTVATHTAIVPEPASLGLIALAGLGLLGRRRSK